MFNGQGRSEEAIAALARAVEAQPARVEYRVQLAGLLMKAGRRSDAERELDQALAMEPDHPKAKAMREGLGGGG